MSPRAACRLDTLGFERVYDYVGGKVDWLAHGLPRDGGRTGVPYAGEMVDADPPTCALDWPVSEVRAALNGSRYGSCLVLSPHRIVLGRVRASGLSDGAAAAVAEAVMEPGPSTVRANTPAAELVERLSTAQLHTAIVTTPSGRLVGVFQRADAASRLG